MRILHVINHTGRFNGNVHAAVDLACAQAAQGHSVAICSGGGDFDALLTESRVEIFTLDRRRSLSAALTTIGTILRLIKRWRPDVVHCHMMMSAVLAYPACKVGRTPLITTVHNAFERSAVLMGLGSRVIAVSEAVGTHMRRRGISAKRLRVVLNGTIGSVRQPRPLPEAEPLEHPAIVYVGGLHPRKGIVDLLQAFERVARKVLSANLYLVGEGPCQEEYRAMAGAMECASRIRFCGARPDPRAYLLGADIFVLASLSDPAPLVLSEAREMGCAIVATNVDGIPELLNRGKAGILVDPGSPSQLAKALEDLLSDKALLAMWRARSQINIGHLSLARVAEETVAVYADCLVGRRMTRATRGDGMPSSVASRERSIALKSAVHDGGPR